MKKRNDHDSRIDTRLVLSAQTVRALSAIELAPVAGAMRPRTYRTCSWTDCDPLSDVCTTTFG